MNFKEQLEEKLEEIKQLIINNLSELDAKICKLNYIRSCVYSNPREDARDLEINPDTIDLYLYLSADYINNFNYWSNAYIHLPSLDEDISSEIKDLDKKRELDKNKKKEKEEQERALYEQLKKKYE